MDLQSFLTNLFTILAFTLPVFLIAAHIQREGWKLSPPVYSGIVGMLASFAMMARQSSFLSARIGNISTGWFTSDIIISMILAFLAAINLAVFDWVVPGLRLRLESIPASLKAYLRSSGQHNAASEFNLEEEAQSDAQGVLKTLLAMAWATLSSLLIIIALGIYLLWPSLIITMDQHEIEINGANRVAEEVRHKENEQRLLARTTNLGGMTNELLGKLKQRIEHYCDNKDCSWQISEKQKLIAEIKSYGLEPKGDMFPVTAFSRQLNSWELVESLQAKIVAHAKSKGISLSHAQRPEASYKYISARPETDVKVIAAKNAQNASRLIDKFLAVVTNPRDALAMLTKDIITSIAIAMECAAIVLAFSTGARRR